MYTKNVPYKDLYDRPKNKTVYFNLTEPEVFKLLVEFQRIFKWQERIKENPGAETPTEEVVAYYNDFEEIILSAYGEPDAEGEHFDHDGKYKFEKSMAFAAFMTMCVTDVSETTRLLDGLMPKGLQEMVKNADAKLAELAKNPETSAEAAAEIERLRTRMAELQSAEGSEAAAPAVS